jgi:lambda repressor-like predicted transcriptional regulator
MDGSTFRSVARDWLIANVLSLLVAAGIRLLSLGVDEALTTSSLASASEANWVGVEVVAAALQNVVYAYLTTAVFRRLVPAFPASAWLSLHFILGIVIGIFFGSVASRTGENETINFNDNGFLVALTLVVLLGGGLVGTAIGSLQALVLRQAAAQGLKSWIAASAAAGVVQFMILVVAYGANDQASLWVKALHNEGVNIVAGLLAAVMMVPALKRLRP